MGGASSLRGVIGGGLLAAMAVGGCNCDDQLGVLEGAIRVEPEILDFGKVPLGAEKKLTLTMENRGSFRLTVSEFNAEPPVVPPAGTATIGTFQRVEVQVGFRPTSLGEVSAELILVNDDPKAPMVSVPVRGEGIEAAVRVDPLVVDFGEVLWDSTTRAERRDVTVSNPGSDSFDLTAVEVVDDAGGAFGLDLREIIRTFNPRAQGSFEVSYLPRAMGPVEGRVRIRTTAAAAPEVEVTLRGRAVGPVLEVCAGATGAADLCTDRGEIPRLDFGLVDRQGMGTGFIRVWNSGDRDLTVQGMVLGAATEFSFTPEITSLGSFTIPASGERRIDATYTPQDYAFDSISVGFTSDSAVRPSAVVRVEARVPKPTINVIPRTLTFTLADQANRAETAVKIINCGEIPLTITRNVVLTQVSGPAPGFMLTNPPVANTTVQPEPCNQDSAGVEFGVVFQPNGNGMYVAEIPIESNDPLQPEMRVEIRGTKR